MSKAIVSVALKSDSALKLLQAYNEQDEWAWSLTALPTKSNQELRFQANQDGTDEEVFITLKQDGTWELTTGLFVAVPETDKVGA